MKIIAKNCLSITLALTLIVSPIITPTVSAVGETITIRHETIATNGSHSMAITENGDLWAWGENVLGELGDGTTENRLTPVKVGEGFVSVSVSAEHSMAIKEDGSLWAWGNNENGQLGDGGGGIKISVQNSLPAQGSVFHYGSYKEPVSTNFSTTPVKVMDNVLSVSAGRKHTMVILEDGSLWAFGNNFRGILGAGASDELYFTPIKVMDDVVAVEAGDSVTVALKTDGSLWFWEQNNDIIDYRENFPQKMADNIDSFSLYDEIVALDNNGTILWSKTLDNEFLPKYNDTYDTAEYGMELKEGTIANEYISNPTQVSTGYRYAMAITDEGVLWGWGNAGRGQLMEHELATTNFFQVGEAISEPLNLMEDVNAVETGTAVLALQNNGDLFGWGMGRTGEIGNGRFDEYNFLFEPYLILEDVKLEKEETVKLKEITYPNTNRQATTETAHANANYAMTIIDGDKEPFKTLLIDGHNYFKLREVGDITNFNVVWNEYANQINIITDTNYATRVTIGRHGDPEYLAWEYVEYNFWENRSYKNNSDTVTKSNIPVYVDGNLVSLDAYIFNGNTYYKLRDIGGALGFEIGWDEASELITIDIPKDILPVSEYEEEFLRLVNIERSRYGLAPLTMSEELCEAAKIRAEEVSENIELEHQRPDGTMAETALDELGICYGTFGENIAIGKKTPRGALQSLMSSVGHRENVMSEDYKQMGVAFKDGYWVQVFTD